jgi:hypothetical protein
VLHGQERICAWHGTLAPCIVHPCVAPCAPVADKERRSTFSVNTNTSLIVCLAGELTCVYHTDLLLALFALLPAVHPRQGTRPRPTTTAFAAALVVAVHSVCLLPLKGGEVPQAHYRGAHALVEDEFVEHVEDVEDRVSSEESEESE